METTRHTSFGKKKMYSWISFGMDELNSSVFKVTAASKTVRGSLNYRIILWSHNFYFFSNEILGECFYISTTIVFLCKVKISSYIK